MKVDPHEGAPRWNGEPPFPAGPVPGWREMHALTPAQVYPPGIELFPQGRRHQEIFFIDQGIVKLVRVDDEGHELIVGLAFSGEFLGASSLIAEAPSAAAAVTTTVCHIQRTPAEVFLHLAKTDPALSWQLHSVFARQLQEQTIRLAQLGALSSRGRLEHVLRQLIIAMQITKSRDIKLHLPLKLWEIAALIAVTPEHLSRLLAQMDREGIIRREKGWVIVPDLQKLRRCGDLPLTASTRSRTA